MNAEPLSLTERRKRDTQLEIARTAARLFSDRGAAAVTAEEIAQQSGVAVRTFYRYFSSKEDAVAPLLTIGADQWHALVAAADPDENVLAALEHTISAVLTPRNAEEIEGLRWTLGLLHAATSDAALQHVWHRVNSDSEVQLRLVLAPIMPAETTPLTLRLLAAAATSALRIALEASAEADRTMKDPSVLASHALDAFRQLTSGLDFAPTPRAS
ncbi:TetR family transcriptional regulator [Salinibacterium sp. NSLL150]|uniref:TetR family transcriptional regulator n=1 Tax=unclassified Salinibacterium TaxID=2632331 RepID=UPI0018CCBE55|nr:MULTISPECIES: TetR family transcriptional regulator [unclassified Salinibacterium]MBH0099320.1 TetR family transcriptional regulator [Salinibacterium sp. NSLL35]MBH0102074.1 TetR family transcriptional regulator [Salinibacterium sp. NSLL150]MBH0104834.1 TetR family transcriptional regulator [Salinibacterium sp. NSLL16]MBH0107594.1 TetR family transcriptional regulator [Salinibacterium sp. NSLL17]MBH0108612.1 TetR family transcriptional regulator [Salinibacterium sp. NG22]